MPPDTAITIEVVGVPCGWPRPRARAQGKHARVYTPKGPWTEWRDAVTLACMEQHGGPPIDGPVTLEIEYRMTRPKGHWGTGKNAGKVKRSAPRWWHTIKPDRDNLNKGTKDGITDAGIWTDDCQVCAGDATKRWVQPGEQPGATIRIREID